MTKLPQIKPKVLISFFIKQGFSITRQISSHVRLAHKNGRKITIAAHNKPLAPGTFYSILKQAGIDKETFLELFRK